MVQQNGGPLREEHHQLAAAATFSPEPSTDLDRPAALGESRKYPTQPNNGSSAPPGDAHIARTDDRLPGGYESPLPTTRQDDSKIDDLSAQEAKPEKPPKTLSFQDKVSVWGMVILLAGSVLILAAVGVLSFLWFADASNSTWKETILRDWLTRAIAISAEVLKQAMTFQTGIMVAMLASLVLERSEATLPHLASFTMMRATAGSGTIVVMLWNYLVGLWHTPRFRGSVILALILLTTLIFGSTQVISILLLSDIGLRTVGGPTLAANTSYAFATMYPPNTTGSSPMSRIIVRAGTWFRKAEQIATFAEYSEPPYEAEGVVDTGVTLRAFLPFLTAQERQSLTSYSGYATVMDSRVTCQIPNFIDPRVQMMNGLAEFLVVNGAVTASRSTPRLGNRTTTISADNGEVLAHYDLPIHFSCLAPVGPSTHTFTGPSSLLDIEEWRFSICQLPSGRGRGPSTHSGGLVSEFKPFTQWEHDATQAFTDRDSETFGTAYLLFNVTTGLQGSWQAVIADAQAERGFSPPAYSHRNEWLDFAFSNGTLVLSTTICYSAFDFANLPVNITSTANRTEPAAVWDAPNSRYNFSSVRSLLGQDHALPPSARGILSLHPPENRNWTATPEQAPPGLEPFPREYADLSLPRIPLNTQAGHGNYGNASGILTTLSRCPSSLTNNTVEDLGDVCTTPEITHVWLVQEMLRSGASPAFVLQAMQTLLAGMAYYDQMWQFDEAAVAERTFFVVANVVVRRSGFIAVAVIVGVHLVLVGAVVWLFVKQTALSRVGGTWSVLAQVVGGEGREYIEKAAMLGDGEVEDMMKKDARRGERVGLRLTEEKVDVMAASDKGQLP